MKGVTEKINLIVPLVIHYQSKHTRAQLIREVIDSLGVSVYEGGDVAETLKARIDKRPPDSKSHSI